MMKTLSIALLTDGTGETAEFVLKAALSQFNQVRGKVERYRLTGTNVDIPTSVARAVEEGAELLVTTLVNPTQIAQLNEEATKQGVKVVNLLQPIIGAIGAVTNETPLMAPGAQRKVNEDYFRRVKAMEFTIACDDGKSPQLLEQADLVIYGVSRAGKTPLSLFLANKGVAVANVPLLPGVDPDPRALQVPIEKRVGLLISLKRLKEIRSERLALLGLDPEQASYTQDEAMERELAAARSLMEKLGCKIYESTDRPMEMLAHDILYDFGFSDRLIY